MKNKVWKYLLCHAIGGIFLGEANRSFIWSDLDPKGITKAILFPDIPSIIEYLNIRRISDSDFYYASVLVEEDSEYISYINLPDFPNVDLYQWNPNHSPVKVLH